MTKTQSEMVQEHLKILSKRLNDVRSTLRHMPEKEDTIQNFAWILRATAASLEAVMKE